MANRLYALLVGLNTYHPTSKINELDACVNDVKNAEKFLKKHYAFMKPEIVTLTNEMATREAVIKAFENHLQKNAKKGDTVFFMFSGHGSTRKSAKEFKKFDDKIQDETLVCYDSRLKGKYDIADKELAVMLSRINQDAHTVVLLDSCHSGSATRLLGPSKSGKRRYAVSRKTARTLSSYLLKGDNYYGDLLKKTKKISFPKSNHILLAACDRDEEAMEIDGKGMFSWSVLQVMENAMKAGSSLSYNAVFDRARALLRSEELEQTPQLEPSGNFDPNTVFLTGVFAGNTQLHLASYFNKMWQIDYGAVHGLSADPAKVKQMKLNVYESLANGKKKKLNKPGEVRYVGVSNCVLDLPGAKTSKNYLVEFNTLPDTYFIQLIATKKEEDKFLKIYEKNPSAYFQFAKEKNVGEYALKISKGQFSIIHVLSNRVIYTLKGVTQKSVLAIVEVLEQIEFWNRIVDLENNDSNIYEEDLVVKFCEEEANGKLLACKNNDIKFDFKKNKSGEWEDVLYQIAVKNNFHRPLYVSMLLLTPDFGITILTKAKRITKNSGWVTIDDSNSLYIEDEKANELTDHFKIIVSTKPFDDQKFQRNALGKNAGNLKFVRKRSKPVEDWATRSIRVTLTREMTDLGTKDLKAKGIIIKGHPKFKAQLNFGTARQNAKGIGRTALPAFLNNPEVEILNFAPKTRGAASIADQSIIELTDIQADESLAKNPLEIEVAGALKKDEYLLPMAIDGEFVFPFAKVQEGRGKSIIQIHDIPAIQDKGRLRQSRNPLRAIRFCIMKMFFKSDDVYKLRYVQFQNGKIFRKNNNLPAKVKKAKKVLLLIHGIIGDTKNIAEALPFAVAEKHYDLVLTYDYENLNSTIALIAEKLNKQLNSLGFDPAQKQLDIVAHSMGGLVSRHMIEILRKDDGLVQRMIMLGTPNGGSAFGKLPEFRDTLLNCMGIAANFMGFYLPKLAALLKATDKVLKSTKPVTTTLAEMSPNSKFTKRLLKSGAPSNTAYTIVAGNITEYKNTEEARFARFMEKLKLVVGRLFYGDESNDIAVATTEIMMVNGLDENQLHEVICHHLNYFVNEESMQHLRPWIRTSNN